MAKQALILIDIQNDYFPQGKWPLAGVEAAADKAQQVLHAFRQAGDAVIHVRHEFTSADAPFFTPGSEGAHIHAKVQNENDEPVVLKHFVNAFRQTNLRELLERHSITDLVVVGSMSHMCIDAVVRAAADYGYNVTVIHDAALPAIRNSMARPFRRRRCMMPTWRHWHLPTPAWCRRTSS
jgi:nicotinamidase-related amidase